MHPARLGCLGGGLALPGFQRWHPRPAVIMVSGPQILGFVHCGSACFSELLTCTAARLFPEMVVASLSQTVKALVYGFTRSFPEWCARDECPLPGEAGAIGARATHHPEETLGQLLQLGGLLIAAPREEPGPREVTPWPRAEDSQSRGRFRVAAPGPAAVPGVPACGLDGGLAGEGSGEGRAEAEWTETASEEGPRGARGWGDRGQRARPPRLTCAASPASLLFPEGETREL